MTFLPFEDSQQVSVMLQNDMILEGDENFFCTLNPQPEASRISLGTNIAVATIEDDDRKYN